MRKSTSEEYAYRLGIAVEMILDNLDHLPSPGTIAHEAGFSRFHFSRIFSGAMGENLLAFARRLRLERAAYALRNDCESVTFIAVQAGYETAEAFAKAFRAEYGKSPSEFRKAPNRYDLQSPSGVHWTADRRTRSVPVMHLIQGDQMEATTTKIEPLKVVALRHIGPYHEIGDAFDRIHRWMIANEVPVQSAIAIYHDDPSVVPQTQLRSDACLQVPDDYQLGETGGLDLRIDTVPGGEYAVATHMGSYAGLNDAWARFLGQAAPSLGRELGMYTFEIYVNDCSKVPEEEVRTDLYVSLA